MKLVCKMIALTLLLFAFLLSGCAALLGSTGMQMTTQPTVEDIFTLPHSTSPTTPTDLTSPSAPGTSHPDILTLPPLPNQQGITGLAIVGEYQEDEIGRYRIYEGGQMLLSLKLSASGASAREYREQGIGIMLYVNGCAQPYRVEEEGGLEYCHVFYPEFDRQTGAFLFDVYFTPVSGEQGEMVEVYATTIVKPNWHTTDPETAWRHTTGTIHVGTRIKLNVTPPESERPAVMERIRSVEIAQEDATYEEIGSWSDEELITKMKFGWYIDGKHPELQNGYMYDWTASDSVQLQFVIWGTPDVRYGLVFYIDNRPLSVWQEILFDMEPGKKTVITLNIDLSDFDGECVIYAALIPRNRLTTPVWTETDLYLSKSYYLLDRLKPEK